MNDDVISRRAAIAVADSSDYVGLSVEDVKKVTDEVVKGLKQLPSAQPEVLACGNGELNARLGHSEGLYVDGFNDGYRERQSEEQKWILCSERLPEEDTYVLATTAWGDITIAEKLSDIAWFIYEGNANAKSDDIVAWMPLPEPWRGEEHEAD